MKKKKLIAIIACRNNSSRLYAKPLQLLKIKKRKTVLEYIIQTLKKKKIIENIILAVSINDRSSGYEEISKKNNVKIYFGDEQNVLKRTIQASLKTNATDIIRITSESPFPYLDNLKYIWKKHASKNYDATFLDNIIDGCGFEIVRLNILRKILKKTNSFQNEHITNYLRVNKNKFNISYISPPSFLRRYDLRLTIDYPEDLIVCREVLRKLKNNITHKKIISFLDKNKHLKNLVKPFLKEGYKSMYL